MPVFKELYKRVASGQEAERVIEACGARNYQKQLGRELAELRDSEMWQPEPPCGHLRPEQAAKTIAKGVKGVSRPAVELAGRWKNAGLNAECKMQNAERPTICALCVLHRHCALTEGSSAPY